MGHDFVLCVTDTVTKLTFRISTNPDSLRNRSNSLSSKCLGIFLINKTRFVKEEEDISKQSLLQLDNSISQPKVFFLLHHYHCRG